MPPVGLCPLGSLGSSGAWPSRRGASTTGPLPFFAAWCKADIPQWPGFCQLHSVDSHAPGMRIQDLRCKPGASSRRLQNRFNVAPVTATDRVPRAAAAAAFAAATAAPAASDRLPPVPQRVPSACLDIDRTPVGREPAASGLCGIRPSRWGVSMGPTAHRHLQIPRISRRAETEPCLLQAPLATQRSGPLFLR